MAVQESCCFVEAEGVHEPGWSRGSCLRLSWHGTGRQETKFGVEQRSRGYHGEGKVTR